MNEKERNKLIKDKQLMKDYVMKLAADNHNLSSNPEHIEEMKKIEIPSNMKEEVEKARKELIEKIAENDEKLFEKYLDGKEIPFNELKDILRKAVIDIEIIPVMTGSALKNKGVQLLLDAVVDYLPAPTDLPPVKGFNFDHGEEERRSEDKEPVAALAFKLASDPYIGNLTYFRLYSGVIKKGSYLLNTTENKQERISRILRMHANHREEIDEIHAGDLGAIVGLKSTTTGDTLAEPRPSDNS